MLVCKFRPNQALQPTHLPSLRYGKRLAELRCWTYGF